MSLKDGSHISDITISSDQESKGVTEGCADPYLPTVVPSKRWDFSAKWTVRITGQAKEFNLGKQPLIQGLLNKMMGGVSLVHPEIHVVWRGLVPPTVASNDLIVTFRFTPHEGEGMGLMAQHTHGMHLYMHHIFYPGHSICVGPNEYLPWAVGFSIPESPLRSDYTVGEVHIRLTGYFAKLPEYACHRASEMISIVPMGEHITGFVTSAPRTPNREWVIRGFKIGVSGKDKAKRIKFLQDIGVDIEALRLVGRLEEAIKSVDRKALNGNLSIADRAEAAGKVLGYLKSI